MRVCLVRDKMDLLKRFESTACDMNVITHKVVNEQVKVLGLVKG